jgi:hypothetical protein
MFSIYAPALQLGSTGNTWTGGRKEVTTKEEGRQGKTRVYDGLYIITHKHDITSDEVSSHPIATHKSHDFKSGPRG